MNVRKNRRLLVACATALAGTTSLVVGITAASAATNGTVNVASGATLTVRSAPNGSATKVGALRDGAGITITCRTTGTTHTGTYGTTNRWDKIASGYVSHAYVHSTASVPTCGSSTPAQGNGTVDVAAGATLSIRNAPSGSATKVGSLPDGARVTITCQTTGTTHSGSQGTTNRWDKVAGGYVSHAYVHSTGSVPSCTGTPTPPPPPPSSGTAVTKTINAATSMVGRYPYVYAGGNFYGATVGVDDGHPSDAWTKGFDCSGLMEYAFYQGAGIKLASISRYQYDQGRANGWLVPLDQRRAGDMVFSARNTGDWTTIHHVALLTSRDSIVEAASHEKGLRTRSWAPSGETMAYVVRPIR